MIVFLHQTLSNNWHLLEILLIIFLSFLNKYFQPIKM